MRNGPVRAEAADPGARPTADVVRTLAANHRRFLAFLERRVRSRALAEDILQDAFVRGVNKLDTLRSDESAVAWFYARGASQTGGSELRNVCRPRLSRLHLRPSASGGGHWLRP